MEELKEDLNYWKKYIHGFEHSTLACHFFWDWPILVKTLAIIFVDNDMLILKLYGKSKQLEYLKYFW